MDPDYNRYEQLQLASKLLEATENDRPVKDEDVLRLSELVIALDEWITKGGFLPKAWRETT